MYACLLLCVDLLLLSYTVCELPWHNTFLKNVYHYLYFIITNSKKGERKGKWTCIAPIVSITQPLSAQMWITQSYLQIHHICLFVVIQKNKQLN